MDKYAATFSTASSLTLILETPAAMESAQTISFHRQDLNTPIGISYAKDTHSIYPRLIDDPKASGLFRSIASQLSGSDRLVEGDLIVGLCYDGEAHHVTGVKELNAQFAAASGDIAIRLVRAPAQENAVSNH